MPVRVDRDDRNGCRNIYFYCCSKSLYTVRESLLCMHSAEKLSGYATPADVDRFVSGRNNNRGRDTRGIEKDENVSATRIHVGTRVINAIINSYETLSVYGDRTCVSVLASLRDDDGQSFSPQSNAELQLSPATVALVKMS